MITAEQLTQAILELKQAQEKTDEQMKKTDEQMKKTDEQIKKTDEQMKKTDAKLERMGIRVGGISNNQGDIAEEFFYNSLADKPVLAGIKYDFMDKNVTRRKGDTAGEYDILLVNGKDVAIVEVKYKAHNYDVERLLGKKYSNFKKLYPEYKNYNHHLVLASFYISEDLKDKALKNNITILQRKGDIIETAVPK
jgi:Holliday junction resolvase-like predicted endonuclease